MRRTAANTAAIVIFWGATFVIVSASLAGRHWVFDLAGQFLLPATAAAFMAGLACAAVYLSIGARREAVLCALFAVVAIGLSTPHIRGVPSLPDSAPGPTLKILQHNALGRNKTPEKVAEQIRDSNPDIAVLLEVSDRTGAALDVLAQGWPHTVKDPLERSRRTYMRILSKHPLTDGQAVRTRTGLAIVKATAATPDGQLTIIAVHLTRPWPFDEPLAQSEQLDELLSVLADTPEPFILLGDFNSAPWGRLAIPLRLQGLRRVDLGERGTWPAFLPARLGIPIDLAFATPCVGLSRGRVLKAAGSDHRAVAFGLGLTECTNAVITAQFDR